MRKILILILLILCCTSSVFGGEFEDTLKAAEQGDDGAQYNLGLMYYKGQGVPQNYKLAYVWESLAAAQGNKEAAKERNLIEKRLTPQQLSEAQDLAVLKQRFLTNLNVKSISDIKPIIDQQSVTGRFITNSTAGTLFVITGKINNITADSISHIEVKGALITKGNIEAMSQTSFCGNIITENALRGNDIADLTNQTMVKTNIDVKPDETVPFMIIFSNLPESLKNFTVKVSGFEKSNQK